jgi:hypothetical protein
MADKLYIKVDEDNMFIDHPHFESNVRDLHPDHDLDAGPPSGWMEFERVEPPVIGPYQKFTETIGGNIALAFPHNGLEYAIVDGKYKDVWHVEDMTKEEKTEKQNAIKAEWAENGFASWTFNEETCSFDPPTEKPDGNYRWDEETTSWVEVT